MNNLSSCESLQNIISLTELPRGSRGVITDVPENPLLYPLGLRPGKELQCQGFQLFGGPLLVKVGERQIALSRPIAEKITVAL